MYSFVADIESPTVSKFTFPIYSNPLLPLYCHVTNIFQQAVLNGSTFPLSPWNLEFPEVCVFSVSYYIHWRFHCYDNDAGAAFVVHDLKIRKGFRLPAYTSIFICELIFILMSMLFLQDTRPLQFCFSLTLPVPLGRFCTLADVPVIWCVKSFTSIIQWFLMICGQFLVLITSSSYT